MTHYVLHPESLTHAERAEVYAWMRELGVEMHVALASIAFSNGQVTFEVLAQQEDGTPQIDGERDEFVLARNTIDLSEPPPDAVTRNWRQE